MWVLGSLEFRFLSWVGNEGINEDNTLWSGSQRRSLKVGDPHPTINSVRALGGMWGKGTRNTVL